MNQEADDSSKKNASILPDFIVFFLSPKKVYKKVYKEIWREKEHFCNFIGVKP